jgi:GxxExxY protein
MDREALDRITLAIIQAGIEVHRHLGPGLLEGLYRECLLFELRARGLKVIVEELIPIFYKGQRLYGHYRIDLLVEDTVIVELKSMETVLPVHYAQVLTYLRLTDKPVGLLINFNVSYLRQGVRRIVNKF